MSAAGWTPPERLYQLLQTIDDNPSCSGTGLNRARANSPEFAEELLRRYNSHAALVAFVEKWREIIGPSMTPGGKRQKALARHLEPWALEFTEEADAALAAARGEK